MKRTDPLTAVLAGMMIVAAGVLVFWKPGRRAGGGSKIDGAERRGGTDHLASGRLSNEIRSGTPLEQLCLRLSKDPNLRPAMKAIVERARANPDAVRTLLQKLSDPGLDPQTRDALALALGALPGEQAERGLVRALAHAESPDWKETLILALGLHKKLAFDLAEGSPFVIRHPSTGLPLLVQRVFLDGPALHAVAAHLDDGSDRVRRAAHRALQHTLLADARNRGPKRDPAMERVRVGFMRRLRDEPVEGLRAAFAHSLAEWAAAVRGSVKEQQETVSAVLNAALNPAAETVRLRTAAGLGRADMDSHAHARILQAAGGGDFDRRSWAMEVLERRMQAGKLHPEEQALVRKAFEQALEDSDAKIREIAARSLRRFQGSQPFLIEALDDPAWHVRVAAAGALGTLGGPEAREALTRVAQADPSEHVRRTAESALRRFGPR